MRIHEFKCDDCGHVEEHFVYNDGANSFVCPLCEGEMFRIISAPRVISMGTEAQAYKELKALEKKKENKKIFSRPY